MTVSTDGGNTWSFLFGIGEALATVGEEWTTFAASLEDFAFWDGGARVFGPDVRIRFSEYDNASAPLDGIAIDDVVVTGEEDLRAVVEIARDVAEGSGPYTGYALLSFVPTNIFILSLSATPGGQLTLPATVDIPAGKTFATFNYSVPDDNRPNLTRTIAVSAEAPGIRSIPSTIAIFDDDLPVISLTLPPQLVEGDPMTATAVISLNPAADVPMTLYLSQGLGYEIDLPYSVTIPAGQTQFSFAVRATDDQRLDGNIVVTVSAGAPGIPPVTAITQTVDNETLGLSIVLPETILEGTSAAGHVLLAGSLTTNVEVRLSANNSSVNVPASVTIQAGSLEGYFSIVAPDNGSLDGTRTVRIDAAADGLPTTNGLIMVLDNDVARYRIEGLTGIMEADTPVSISIGALDPDGNLIRGLNQAINFSLVNGDGSVQPVSPATIILSDGSWFGSVTFPPVGKGPARLRVEDPSGLLSESIPFDFMRFVNVRAADLVWDPARARIYASVPANSGDTNANKLLVIDPANARVAGGLQLSQDPGQLALTSGGEYLYAVLNGNGTIARINPDSMTVESTFPVGSDPQSGTLYADDVCTVKGQPQLLVVSQKRGSAFWPPNHGVAAYDNGVARPSTAPAFPGNVQIEPSADPVIFFAFDRDGGPNRLRRLQLDGAGLTVIETKTGLDGDPYDFRTDGGIAFFNNGLVWDGVRMKELGSFSTGGPVCPDLAANRVFFIESIWPSFGYYQIGAYDPASFSNIRRFALPRSVDTPGRFIRWGTNGLALQSGSRIALFDSNQIVPSGAPADLLVNLTAVPNPAFVPEPLTYTLSISNQGPNVAGNTILVATLSSGQTLRATSADRGTSVIQDNVVTFLAGDLAVGGTATLTVTTLPQTAGVVSLSASGFSDSNDPYFSDNLVSNVVTVGFRPSIDVVHSIRLGANNLAYDSGRNRLWVSIRAPTTPVSGSVVSIDPATGLSSEPILFSGDPRPGCMALSANGRYLYLGLNDSQELLRFDLSSAPSILRVPLVFENGATQGYADDVEPLDGDGSSFLVVTSVGAASVFDGTVFRASRTDFYAAGQIERTATPGVFSTYRNSVNPGISTLMVTSSGVAVRDSAPNLVSGAGVVCGAGNLLLASTGYLVDVASLTLKASLGASGSPCLDLPNNRAYLVGDGFLRGFDLETTLSTQNFPLPALYPLSCVRWGPDGFAILGGDGDVSVLRWSGTIPAGVDSNADGMSDDWQATYFATLNVDPAADTDGDGLSNFEEYVFGTSPILPNANPLHVSTTNVVGQFALRLIFPRRAALTPRPYDYTISTDLASWSPATNSSETVLSTETVEGISIETVEATIPFSGTTQGFLRLEWSPH